MIPYDFIYFSIDYYKMQFDKFFCYKEIGRKAFFTMATLLMPLLENELAHYWQFGRFQIFEDISSGLS